MIKRILIVDDSVVARTVIRRKLEIIGFKEVEFLEAGNGVEALDKLKSQEFHLVFTDLNMPEMDGTQLLKRIKSSPRLTDIPVIIISSLTNPTKEQQLLSEHALKVFRKPFSLPEMNQFFSEYLKEEEDIQLKIENNEIINALEISVSEAFEEMAFAEVDKVEVLSSLPTFSPQDIFASIELRNPVDGRLHMVMQKEYAYELTRLVIDQPGNLQSLVGDSIAEMINTIAGSMMRRLASNMEYKLGLPVFGEVSESRDDLRTCHSSCLLLSFEFEEQKIYFVFKPTE